MQKNDILFDEYLFKINSVDIAVFYISGASWIKNFKFNKEILKIHFPGRNSLEQITRM